jgi:DnaJ-class molecular chaperone
MGDLLGRVLIDAAAWLAHGDISQTRCREIMMANEKGPNIKKKQKCKNCEGKGLLKKGDKVVKCQRCKGTGVR